MRTVEVTGCRMCLVLADPAIDMHTVVDENKSNGLPVLGPWGFKIPRQLTKQCQQKNSKSWLRVSEDRIIIVRVPQKAQMF